MALKALVSYRKLKLHIQSDSTEILTSFTFGKAADLYKHGPFDAGFWKEQVPVYYTLW